MASGEWPATAGRRVTSWKKKQQQVPRCARNDNSRGVGALRVTRRKGREKRKSPKRRARDRVGTGWRSRIGMNSAQPIAAERIRCSWGVRECAAMGPVGRKVGALVMRWKKRKRKRKRKSRAPFAARGKQARPLEGLVGPRRKRVA